jgi:hypothetical protein
MPANCRADRWAASTVCRVRFLESVPAHRLLDGVRGIEIGGAAHNAFGLDTWNVDLTSHLDSDAEKYRLEQRRMRGGPAQRRSWQTFLTP